MVFYFYNNLFNPDKNSKIQNKKRLNKKKKKIEILLNELFVLDDQQESEVTFNEYVNEDDITIT